MLAPKNRDKTKFCENEMQNFMCWYRCKLNTFQTMHLLSTIKFKENVIPYMSITWNLHVNWQKWTLGYHFHSLKYSTFKQQFASIWKEKLSLKTSLLFSVKSYIFFFNFKMRMYILLYRFIIIPLSEHPSYIDLVWYSALFTVEKYILYISEVYFYHTRWLAYTGCRFHYFLEVKGLT